MLSSQVLGLITALPKRMGWAVWPEVRSQGTGFFLQAHYIAEYWPFLHLSLKVVPSAQKRWLRRRPDLMVNQERRGERFFTLGAGPIDAKLVPGYNRTQDVIRPKVYVQRLPRGAARNQDEQIERLLHWHERYQRRLDFTPIPWPWAGGKANNCNAYIGSLLALLKVPKPQRLPHRFYVPSFRTPLALSEFGN